MEHNVEGESALKPVDRVDTKVEGISITFNLGDTKGKKAAR